MVILVEMEECRRCAICCQSCIFLDYDDDTQLFTCLIYNNKNRTIVRLLDYKERLNNEIYPFPDDILNGITIPSDRILREIFLMIYDESIKDQRKVCDTWRCLTHFKNLNYRIITETKLVMKQRYDVIPDFDILVEILNT